MDAGIAGLREIGGRAALEEENRYAGAAEENRPGAFMPNRAEPLLSRDYAGWGLNPDPLPNGRFSARSPGGRGQNTEQRFENQWDRRTSPGTPFDQIPIPVWMNPHCVEGSFAVAEYAEAIAGERDARASAHLPVHADFIYPAN